MSMGFFSNRKQEKEIQENNQFGRTEYLLHENSPFNMMEAFRDLKMRISVSIPKTAGGTVIMTTSSYPTEGKTTVAVNLAQMFAFSDAKVLLLDADIRKGRIHKYFKGKSKSGLSDRLSAQCTTEEVIRPTNDPNLFYLPCGTHSPRPYELLESGVMKDLIEELRSQFDYIIIDTPPVLVISDALALVDRVDGVVFVCRHEASYMSDVSRSLATLQFAKANVLGVVVNDYNMSSGKYRNGYKHYYYTSYGYGSTNPNATSDNPQA